MVNGKCGWRPNGKLLASAPVVIGSRIAERLSVAGISQSELARRLGVRQSTISGLIRGEQRSSTHLHRIARELSTSIAYLEGDTDDPSGSPEATSLSSAPEYDLVPIESIDLQYGLGATFTDQHVEVEVLQFPRQWVESFTRTPSNLLTFARGRGDSMMPTIHSNDMVLIDRSQRTIAERDAIWAFTIGDIGGIKRLRPVGDRVVILSDNPSVPPDEAMADEVRIVGRVITIIRNI